MFVYSQVHPKIPLSELRSAYELWNVSWQKISIFSKKQPEPRPSTCPSKFSQVQDEHYEAWNSASFAERESSKKSKKVWVKPYLRQRIHSFSILQRKRRLTQIRTHGTKAHCFLPDSEEASIPSKSDLDREINDLMDRFWDSEHVLIEMYQRRPHTLSVKELETLLDSVDEFGRPFIWFHDRDACVEAGGCCSRACGCCEKELISWYTKCKGGIGKELCAVSFVSSPWAVPAWLGLFLAIKVANLQLDAAAGYLNAPLIAFELWIWRLEALAAGAGPDVSSTSVGKVVEWCS
ncbi:hypothetical protein BDV25DRAFT_138880 [Aspergillus avenaceus]|uniref:Uncharacterized protein n=1 Tax=Aspergillus avenaceus TaxID=36643 RepID=A0A5N6TZG9_ASPAV|nr:hypothetical protein BDV25DRAFT_138880 [Aspergillus avenaceus]